MAAGLALTVAQTLFAALDCTELRELSSMLGYKSRLGDLKRTVSTIKAVLLDADSHHHELTQARCDWIEKLKDAVYDADDLFDELTTKAQLLKRSPGGKLYKKVRRFFSSDNQLLFGFVKSREIKKLREKLDGIAEDRWKFGFSDEYRPVKRREETSSYVYEMDIIGREAEKEEIVGLLLSDSNSCVRTQKNVSFVSIVGMGGLGKTALAQLVFNDNRIKLAFGENLYWVCVSEEFGLQEILFKFPNFSTKHTLQELQEEVLKKIGGKKYLLVLDDVWEEKHHKWLDLMRILSSGGSGSQILVTTRSNRVAKAIDQDAVVYELKGLSDIHSWQLFKRIAFGLRDDDDTHLVEIGKDIVKKCANVPLSIKVTGSLLYDLDISKWEEYISRELINVSCYGEKDHIMSILMFSYYNLTPELKSCFSLCSLFPKDYDIEKEVLISLWLAQGYLVPSHEGESMEDVGANYFRILLQRCFFQDVKRDEYDEIHSCKMHDLMHDLAQKVARKESLILTSSSESDDLEQKLRHLSATSGAPIYVLSNKYCPSSQTLRTLFKIGRYSSMNVATVALNCRRLRVLHLRWCDMNLLPDELGKFLHLRYLDLSYSYTLMMLPSSITKLYNLQILKLRECEHLTGLPKDIGKLVNLMMLDIHGCSRLKELPQGIVELVNLKMLNIYKKPYYQGRCKITCMPVGMDRLRKLHTLTYFAVGGVSFAHAQKGELIDLKGLISLRGQLCIKVGKFSSSNMPIPTKGADILRKAHLKGLEIICDYQNGNFEGQFDQGEYQETLLEGLYPNSDLKELLMSGYQGINFPNWGIGKVTFPAGIVRMELTNCTGLKHLSSLSKLVCLKYLHLYGMKNLEYIESDVPSDLSQTFFPSLEKLVIKWALNLKGWWRGISRKEKEATGSGSLADANGRSVEILPSFTRLCHLEFDSCRSLEYFPPRPHLKRLYLWGEVNGALTFCMRRSTYFHPGLVEGTNPSTSLSSDLSSNHPTLFCLERFAISNTEEVFNSIFQESFLSSVHIQIHDLFSVKGITGIKEGFQRCPSSVRHLSITHCCFPSLTGGGMEYLTNLQSLKIERCPSLNSLGEDDKDGLPWKSLAFLSSLVLIKLPLLVSLPKDFQYLTSLRSLQIEECENLENLGEFFGSLTSLQSVRIKWCSKVKALPEAMCHLTSVTQLEIRCPSSELVRRCQKPDGEDWPNICHIPNLIIHW